MTTTVARPRGSYAKSAAIRQRVLDACVDAFAVTGFYGATMKDIAVRAGISYNGLLHHFPTKELLLAAVLEYRDERGTRTYREAEALIGQSDRPVRAMLDVALRNELEPGLIELHATLSAEATSPSHPAHDYFRRRYQGLRQFYQEAFETLREQGELRTPLSPEALASAYIALMDGLQVQWLYERDTQHVDVQMRAFLNSVLTQH